MSCIFGNISTQTVIMIKEARRRRPMEVIDLSSESEPETLIEPARAQEAEDPRLSHLKCVICLDNPTDLTATTCGHLFCHECITAALRVGQTQTGNCPVCRRKLNTKGLIPLNIMKRTVLTKDVHIAPPHKQITPPRRSKRSKLTA